jgi:hypothetical protein
MLSQLPRVPSLIPRSRATSAMGLPVSSTICTASALNCGLNLRRCSGMDRSSQQRVTVQDRWYTPSRNADADNGLTLALKTVSGAGA